MSAFVLLPCLQDIHQDHQVIAREGVRAFKAVSILGYEEPWNNLDFPTQAIVGLTRSQLDKKIKALSHYRTQQHRHYSKKEAIEGLARTRGLAIATEFAEAFSVIRWVVD